MATARHLGSTASSTNGDQFTHVIDPDADELIVVFAIATDTQDPGECTGSVTGTFTEVSEAVKSNTDDEILRCYVSDALSDGSVETITYEVDTDIGSGGIVSVYGVSGMGSNVGALAVRQQAVDNNNPTGTEPVVVLDDPCLNTNVVLVAAANNAGVGFDGVNPSSSACTQDDIDSFTSPTTALVVYSADSGETLDTFTWPGDVTGGQSCAMVVELDVPAAGTTHNVSASFDSTASIAAAQTRELLRSASLDSTVSISAAQVRELLRSAALAAAVDIAASATSFSVLSRSASFDAAVDISTAQVRELLRSVDIGAAVDLDITATKGGVHLVSASFDPVASIDVTPQRELLRSASLDAAVDIAVAATKAQILIRSASFEATIDIESAVLKELVRSASIDAEADVDVTVSKVLERAARLAPVVAWHVYRKFLERPNAGKEGWVGARGDFGLPNTGRNQKHRRRFGDRGHPFRLR